MKIRTTSTNMYIVDAEFKKGDKILNPVNEIQTCVSLEKGIGTEDICWIKVKETTTLQQILNSDKIIAQLKPELTNIQLFTFKKLMKPNMYQIPDVWWQKEGLDYTSAYKLWEQNETIQQGADIDGKEVEIQMCCNKYTHCNSNCRFDGTEKPLLSEGKIIVKIKS